MIIALVVLANVITIVCVCLSVLYLYIRPVHIKVAPSYDVLNAPQLTAVGFTLAVILTITVQNENYFPIILDNVTVHGTHTAYTGQLGVGETRGITLVRRDNSTFQLPVEVTYNASNDPTLAYMASLISNCSKATDNNVFFDALILVEYKAWARGGIFRESRNLIIPCPIDPRTAALFSPPAN